MGAVGEQITERILHRPSPALGVNGWVYVCTRKYDYKVNANTTEYRLAIVAINPAAATGQQVRWKSTTSDPTAGGLGAIAAPVLDRAGFVYTTEFEHHVEQFDAAYGTLYRKWTQNVIVGKLCQTPTLTEDGLLLLGESSEQCDYSRVSAFRVFGTGNDEPLWDAVLPHIYNGDGTCVALNLFGSPAVRSNGRIYFADSAGRVFRINGSTPMMEGVWPSLAGGNRRAGLPLAYNWKVTSLSGPYDYQANPSTVTLGSIDPGCRTVGAGLGSWTVGSYPSYRVAFWKPLAATTPQYGYNQRASDANSLGDAVGATTTGTWIQALVWPLGVHDTSVFATTLPLPPGMFGAYANAAVEDRSVVGYSYSSTSVQLTRWTLGGNGSWTPNAVLGPAGGYAYGLAANLPEVAGVDGLITGKAKFETGGSATYRAFRHLLTLNMFDATDDLGTLADTATQRLYNKNSEGLDVRADYGIVGRSQNFDGVWRAFHVPVTGMITQDAALPGLLAGGSGTTWTSTAVGINHLGIKVGTAQTNNPNGSGLVSRAVTWSGATGNQITDLNGLLPANSGWILTSAASINDAGFIIGYGTFSGAPKAYLLYPDRTVN